MRHLQTPTRAQNRPPADPTAASHLHRLTVKKMDVGLLLLWALADQQKERREVLFWVKSIAAVDGFVGVALQLVLEEKAKRTFHEITQSSGHRAPVHHQVCVLTRLWMSLSLMASAPTSRNICWLHSFLFWARKESRAWASSTPCTSPSWSEKVKRCWGCKKVRDNHLSGEKEHRTTA